jgi:hypothetical protein
LIDRRINGESTDENNGTASPSTQNRFSGFRPASAHSSACTTPSKPNETDKPLWNSTNIDQPNNKSPFQTGTTNNSEFIFSKILLI